MAISTHRFIDPHLLTAIADLRLLAKRVVDGFMIGMHQSPKAGAGLEFNQYRSYEPGDDPRLIDWKMLARSDRYYVRESEVDTSVSVYFFIDATASMAHEEAGITKIDYARFLAAALGYLAHQQGDAIGLFALNNLSIVDLPPRRDRSQLHRFLHQLERLQVTGEWPDWQRIENRLLTIRKRELLVFISDFYERDGEIMKALSKLSAIGHEVLLFHLMGQGELQFEFAGSLLMEDLESGETVEVDAESARHAYIARLQDWLKQLYQDSSQYNLAYERLLLQQPLDFALRGYLRRRAKLV